MTGSAQVNRAQPGRGKAVFGRQSTVRAKGSKDILFKGRARFEVVCFDNKKKIR